MPTNPPKKTSEPLILRRGKAFHKRVQDDWAQTARDGEIRPEKSIALELLPGNAKRLRRGRMDLFVDDLGDFVSIVEIKSTDWDRVKPRNIGKLLGAHRRQVWKYIEEYVDGPEQISVCPGIIYPSPPNTPGLRERIEDYLNGYGLQVVWYEE